MGKWDEQKIAFSEGPDLADISVVCLHDGKWKRGTRDIGFAAAGMAAVWNHTRLKHQRMLVAWGSPRRPETTPG